MWRRGAAGSVTGIMPTHPTAVLRRAAALALVASVVTLTGAFAAIVEPPTGADDTPAAIARGVEILLDMQEGDDRAEWPYEGVYRVRGENGREIPIGYRVGGTGICVAALLDAPGYVDDPDRQAAVARAVEFICVSTDHPLMSEREYAAGYDVRGWGYCYGGWALLRLRAASAVPDDLADAVDAAIAFYVDAVQKTEIPRAGGWNYARPQGREKPGRSSPFMTGAALQMLFDARAQGESVSDAVIERGLDALERSRTAAGAHVYAGAANERSRDRVPGAVGRMLIAESTLMLAGRGGPDRVRAALDAFIVHWDWLDQRRAQNGTHIPPYGIAPYYFYFAHYYAAQAIELLPPGERAEYRRRVHELIFRNRLADGGWNDRVFPRSRNYGTAMCMLALAAPEAPAPASWSASDDTPGGPATAAPASSPE